MKNIYYYLILLMLSIQSCGKEFLDLKRDSKLRIFENIDDYQALLDNSIALMNNGSCHELGLIGSDEYYILNGRWSTLSRPYQRNAYVWAKNIYEFEAVPDWEKAYERILYANISIEGAEKLIKSSDKDKANNVLGSGLFFRALNHYQLAQLFCLPYNEEKADIDLGIPLRLSSDVSIPVKRVSVKETYNSILSDLHKAKDLLPLNSINKFRPSKVAAYAQLAKTYLIMGNYTKAAKYADSSLLFNSKLIDYNDLDLDAEYLFPFDYGENQDEVIFTNSIVAPVIMNITRMNVDTGLLNMYDEYDLRKRAFFRKFSNGSIIFKGSYYQTSFFTGIATDELYLISAECHSRLGNLEKSLNRLNVFLSKRISKSHFIPISDINSKDLLKLILDERKKQLLFRGVRWEDLRRLNMDSNFELILKRNIDGQYFELLPNSKKYVWPIPDNVIELSSLEQNDR